ncbi:glycosyl hydrolase family 18 protein [Candidatus Methanoperedens nitratireducens]|uniref:GH18 domain-containing protein n=1 Tax=Candidatus Methanoperedens nitratireducens TaxID=1392998 RepID=A0A284VQY2_9EURY|nr:glycosyl hydrolase family 18 protein [Candidatus Methanoperedens nitroreducens]SNQ61619.1 exported hypothetical protein [Candidatus Methanoperedens nitroreducens]
MSFLNLRIILFMLAAFMTPITVSVGTAMAQNQFHSRVVYAFWPYWTDPSSYQPDWNVLTYVAYHSWDANSDGTLSAPGDINQFNTVKNVSRQNGVKMIISVKSFDKDTLDSIFAYHKDDLANNILNVLQTYGADGVNLDFEYPRTINIYTDTPNSNLFEEFTRILHNKLKSRNQDYYISLNVAGNVEEVYRNAALSKYTDSVFLRGYNYNSSNSPVTGAPSPYIDLVNSVNLLKNYYPSNKIVLGLYFSGYDWPSSSSEPESNTTGKGVAVPMKKAIANAKKYGRLWDSNSRTPWYKYQTEGVWHQTWYDDDQSLGLKLDYINSKNLGGAGFWALGYEGNNANIWNMVREKFVIEPMAFRVPAVTPAEIPRITTVKPVETPKTPGFGLMVSLIVLFACAFLARWRNK